MKKKKSNARRVLTALAGCCVVLVAAPASACFTVLSVDDRVIYSAEDAPVDMSRPIHETMPSAFPGGHLVFDLGSACAAGPNAPRVEAAVQPSSQDAVLVRLVSGPRDAVPDSVAAVAAGAPPAAVAAGGS